MQSFLVSLSLAFSLFTYIILFFKKLPLNIWNIIETDRVFLYVAYTILGDDFSLFYGFLLTHALCLFNHSRTMSIHLCECRTPQELFPVPFLCYMPLERQCHVQCWSKIRLTSCDRTPFPSSPCASCQIVSLLSASAQMKAQGRN